MFYVGDKTGDALMFLEDSFISLRELRSWNEARTLHQLRFYSNRQVTKSTPNLAAYYMLSELSYAIFESVSK